MSPSLLFSQPITNLVWNRCRSAPYNSRNQVTFSARKYLWLCGKGGGGGGDLVVLSTFRNTHIFRDRWRSLLGYYNPFYVFSFIRIYFFNLLNLYPVTRFLVTPLLVTTLRCLVIPVRDILRSVWIVKFIWGRKKYYVWRRREWSIKDRLFVGLNF